MRLRSPAKRNRRRRVALLGKALRRFVLAIQFLTTIPIPGNYVKDEKDLGRSVLFYPIVGLLIGLETLGLYRLASRVFMPVVSMVIAYVGNIMLTGGLHIDGFGDMCDGFYAGKDKQGILAIMKDSHIGTMAVLGIFCLLILKLSLLYSVLPKDILAQTILVIPAISRWVISVAAGIYHYAREEGGTAKPFVENVGRREIIISSFLISLISFIILGPAGILLSISTLAIALIFMRWVKNKIGGITGDILGGLNEISEVCSLVMLNLGFPLIKTLWNY